MTDSVVVGQTSGRTGPGGRSGWQWDVALSFAGAQRDYVEKVAQTLAVRGHPLLLPLLMSRPICGGSTWLGTAGHLWRAGGGSGDVRCPLSMPPGLDTASAPGRACRAARELQEPVGAVEAAALATAPSPRTAVCGQMSRGPGRAPGRSALARNSGPASVSGWRTSSARAVRRPGAADHAGNESAAFIAGLRDWPARFRRRAPIPCPDPEGDTW